MKLSELQFRESVQELLFGVVVQAAEDYREESVRLIHDPKDMGARKKIERISKFFLSEDFDVFTKVAGSYILHRLEKEIEDLKVLIEAVREAEEELRMYYRVCLRNEDPEDMPFLLPALFAGFRTYIELRSEVPEYALPLCPMVPGYKKIIAHMKKWRKEYADETGQGYDDFLSEAVREPEKAYPE